MPEPENKEPLETDLLEGEDEAQLDAAFDAIMRGEDGEQKTDEEKNDAAGSEIAEQNKDANANADEPTPGDGEIKKDEEKPDETPALSEFEKRGLELKHQAEAERAKAEADKKPEDKKPDGEKIDTETIKAAIPSSPETSSLAIDFAKLPKVVMDGDSPVSLEKTLKDAEEHGASDDAIKPLLTLTKFALSELSKGPQPPNLDGVVKAEELKTLREEIVRDRAVMGALADKAFYADIAALGAPEIFAIVKDPKHEFRGYIDQAGEGTKFLYDKAVADGDAEALAGVINEWKAGKEKAKVVEIDNERVKEQERKRKLYAPNNADTSRRQQSAPRSPNDEMTDEEADAAFAHLMKTL